MSKKSKKIIIILSFFVIFSLTSIFFNYYHSFNKEKGKVLLIGVESIYSDLLKELTQGSNDIKVETLINRNIDPHSFEASLKIRKKLTSSDLILANGLSYDAWITKMKLNNIVYASNSGIQTINGNPHIFFSLKNMQKIGDYITNQYLLKNKKINDFSKDKIRENYRIFSDKMQKALVFEDEMKQYTSNTPILVTESLPLYLLNEMNFTNLTPPSFTNAITNGETPNNSEITQIKTILNEKKVKLLVYNAQNSTPIVEDIKNTAKNNNIPIVQIYEMPQKSYAYITDWYLSILNNIKVVLEK